MPYIAELQINVDSSQLDSATQKLKQFTQATDNSAKAEGEARKIKKDSAEETAKLLSQIDRQTSSLNKLALQQKKLSAAQDAGQIDTATYEKYSRIIAENIDLVQKRGTVVDQSATKNAQAIAREVLAEEKRYDAYWQNVNKRLDLEAKEAKQISDIRKKAVQTSDAMLVAEADTRAREQARAAKEAIREERNKQAQILREQRAALAEEQRMDKIRYQNTLRRWSEEEKAARVAEKANKSALSSTTSQAKALDNLLASIDPVTREMQRLAQLETQLKAARSSDQLNEDQYRRYQRVIDETRQTVSRYNNEMNRTGITAKQVRLAQQQLPAQFTDIIVSLQGGQAPLTVLLQQGGQIKDMFGGIGPAIRGVSGALVQMINPATVAAAVLATFAVGALAGAQNLDELEKALIATGNATGLSAQQLRDYAETAANLGTGSIRENVEAVRLLAENAKLVPSSFDEIASAATSWADVTGAEIKDVIADFTSLGKEPVEAAVKLNEKYRFLTASVHEQAAALVAQGREQEAIKLLTGELATVMEDRARRMVESANWVSRAWAGAGKTISDAWSSFTSKLAPTQEQELRKTQAEIDKIEARFATPDDIPPILRTEYNNLIAERGRLVNSLYESRIAAAEEAEEQRKQSAIIAQQTKYLKDKEAAMTAVAKAERNLREFEKQASGMSPELAAEGRKFYAEELKKAQEAAQKKADARTPNSAIIDDREANELQNRVNQIVAEYKRLNSEVEKQRSSGTISAASAFEQRKQLLDRERAETVAAYQTQIAELEKLKTSKNISQNQLISLDRKIADARSKMVVAEEKAQEKLNALATKEQDRLAKQRAAIAAYAQNMQLQIDNLVKAGERARQAVGLTNNERGLQDQLNTEDDRYTTQQRELANQLILPDADTETIRTNMEELARSHAAMKKQIVKNYQEMRAAERDWAAGISRAFKQYVEDGSNYARLTDEAFTSAFGHMEDALVNFVTTGKLSFSDLSKAIISDMARIATRIAASQILMSIFGSFATPTAPATASMNSATSYNMGMAAAKGAAFKGGGVNYFAKGGAFTNSVVSSPTAFKHSGGLGVMGEAGPEAIMPLTRNSNGELGVKAQVDLSGLEGIGGGGVLVQVNVDGGTGQTESSASDPQYEEFGKELGATVQRLYKQYLAKDLAPGGDIWKSFNQRG